MIATVFIAISAIKRTTISMVFFQDNKMPAFVARQDHRLKGMWHWCHRSYNLRVLGQPKR